MARFLHTQLTNDIHISINLDMIENFFPTTARLHDCTDMPATIVMQSWHGNSQRVYEVKDHYSALVRLLSEADENG